MGMILSRLLRSRCGLLSGRNRLRSAFSVVYCKRFMCKFASVFIIAGDLYEVVWEEEGGSYGRRW